MAFALESVRTGYGRPRYVLFGPKSTLFGRISTSDASDACGYTLIGRHGRRKAPAHCMIRRTRRRCAVDRQGGPGVALTDVYRRAEQPADHQDADSGHHGAPQRLLGVAAILTVQSGIPIARVELLDEVQVRACKVHSKLSTPEVPTLFVEFHTALFSDARCMTAPNSRTWARPSAPAGRRSGRPSRASALRAWIASALPPALPRRPGSRC